MVHRIFPATSDFENLSKFKVDSAAEANTFDYSGVVVRKPWGYEYLWFQNSSISAWILHVTNGSATSTHCHSRKRTSLIVMSGEVVCSTIDSRHRLTPGDAVVLEPCVFHSSMATSEGGAFVMEIETPPLKGDLVRLRDQFGREGKTYENARHYSTDLDEFDYQPLDRLQTGESTFAFKEIQMCLGTFRTAADIESKLLPGGIAVPLLGRLVFGRTLIADIGETILSDELLSKPCPAAFPPVELLQMVPFQKLTNR